MTLTRVWTLALIVLSVVVIFPARAHAQTVAATAEHTQLLGGIRFGTDDLNLGLGFRGGYTLSNNVYIGGMFDYFFGESEERSSFGYSVEASAHMWVLAAEGGYDFGITPQLVIRPFGGIGIANAFGEACVEFGGTRECNDASESDAALLLGGLMHYAMGSLLVGPELRVMIADDAAFVFGGHIGGMF